jgi:hypothetical protein
VIYENLFSLVLLFFPVLVSAYLGFLCVISISARRQTKHKGMTDAEKFTEFILDLEKHALGQYHAATVMGPL